MLAIKPSRQLLVALICAAVLLFGVVAFVYCGQSSKLHKLNVEVKAKRSKLADSQVIAQRLSDVENRLADAKADLNTLEQGVNRPAYVPTMLRQLEDLGKGVDLRVVGVRPKLLEVKPQPVAQSADGGKSGTPTEVEKPKPYDELGISIEANGKYWDVVKFVDKITAFPKIVAVKSVQMYPLGGQTITGGSPELVVKLESTAFILKEVQRPAQDARQASAPDSGAPI